MNDYIVETVNLTKDFKNFKAVDSINLNIKKERIYGFLGPNGAGKSTTLKMLLGLIKPTSGEGRIFSKDINKNREEILSNIGALIESPSYYAHLTAYENLEIIRRVLKIEKESIEEALKLVNLWEVRNKKVKEFSLGMKQRLGIAQALIGNPKLLILDEPTNGLDPAGIIEMRELIKSLPKKKGITVIISSHILSEIELIASEVGVINKGKLIYEGTLEELKEKSTANLVLGIDNFESVKKSAYKILVNRGYKVVEELGKFFIKADNIIPSKVCREMVMAGFDINYLTYEQKSLEDIFLCLTRGTGLC
ncbi:ABC transporter ATP-binding protein [Clostridium tarantellae]|uniref:ATP-binding cassette domain-containing protein n=1 Tax=Clostridium tarantellae TaxID=39493 RepID=A0A6I1MHD7_9CLOT|nr:ABC transporter ATP-binding protein [Clostridium tarantellae]MPQ42946.1 ATP-binding cassette domain-containing protein [Clostridium tarantellae]